MGSFIDLAGQKFGYLTVVEKTNKRSSTGSVMWLCLCVCGKHHEVRSTSLKDGTTKSCGCYFLDVAKHKGLAKKTHGMTGSRVYASWTNMKDRCLNKNNKKYKDYGGRGITICDRWKNSFENFFEDMGDRPKGYSIERMDVNGNYEPSNCKWANAKEQQNNRRNNLIIEYNFQRYTLQQLCDLLGKNSDKVGQRLKRGDSIEWALR